MSGEKYSENLWAKTSYLCGILGIVFLIIPIVIPRVPGLAVLLLLRIVGIDTANPDVVHMIMIGGLFIASLVMSGIGLISGVAHIIVNLKLVIKSLRLGMILEKEGKPVIGVLCSVISLLTHCVLRIIIR